MYVYKSNENQKLAVIALTPPPVCLADKLTQLIQSEEPKQIWETILPYCGTWTEKKRGEVRYTIADAAGTISLLLFEEDKDEKLEAYKQLIVFVKKHVTFGRRFVKDEYSGHLVDREIIGMYTVPLFDREYADAIALNICEEVTRHDLNLETLSRRLKEDEGVIYEVYVKD